MDESSRSSRRRPLKQQRSDVNPTLLEDEPPPPREVDRIDALPDDVLISIIALLPVEQWVALSAVSRRWLHLFSLLPREECFHLKVTSEVSYLPPPPGPFPRALLRRCHIVGGSFFGLDSHRELLRRVKMVGVKELTLENYWEIRPSFEVLIPNLVLSIKSLTALKLLGSCLKCRAPRRPSRPIASLVGICCKQLRTLEVQNSLIHQHILHLILANCLALETLHLVDSYGFMNAEIRSPSLKKLWLKPWKSMASIVVDAPELQNLVLEPRLELDFLNLQAPKTREVRIEFAKLFRGPEVRIKGFLLAAKDLMSLDLGATAVKVLAMECLAMEYDELEKLNVVFEKLMSLSICFDIKQQSQALFLVKLLESCPSLTSLNLEVIQTRTKNNDAMSNALEKISISFEKLKSLSICLDIKQKSQVLLLFKLLESCHSLSSLNLKVIQTRAKNHVAMFSEHIDALKRLGCLSHHLKEVNMDLLLSVLHELTLARFFMTEAKGLKKMKLKLPIAHINKDIRDMFPLSNAHNVDVNVYNGMKTIEITY